MSDLRPSALVEEIKNAYRPPAFRSRPDLKREVESEKKSTAGGKPVHELFIDNEDGNFLLS